MTKKQDFSLSTRTSREKLKIQQKRYYLCIDKGRHLAYYKGKLNGGKWIARFLHESDRYEEFTLGIADDVLEADGIKILTFSQARVAAEEWFKKKSREESGITKVGPYTVADAFNDYLLVYKHRGQTDEKNLTSQIKSILPFLGHIQLERLATTQIREWHSNVANTPPKIRTKRGAPQAYKKLSMSEEDIRKRKVTANRLLTVLKAALNEAFKEGKVETDLPWRRVNPFKGVDVPTIQYLTLDESQKLIMACEPEIKNLVLAALFSGCRYGEIIRLVTADLDVAAAIITIRLSKSGKFRHINLNDQGLQFFSSMTKNLPKDALIFRKPDGSGWKKSEQYRPLKRAYKAAGLKWGAFKILRHSYATGLINGDTSLPVIALSLGHSGTRITERHYAHLMPSFAANEIRANMPKLELIDIDTPIQ